MRVIFLLLTASAVAFGQFAQRVRFVSTNPSGACGPSFITQNITTGVLTGCVGGTWTALAGGGGGPTAAADITAGTFGAGDYVFPSDLVVTDTLTIGARVLTQTADSVAVIGSSNLTTVGAIPYVSASGVLSQDQTAGGQLFWDPTNHRLGIGTLTPAEVLEVSKSQSASTRIKITNTSAGSAAQSQLLLTANANSGQIWQNGGGNTSYGGASSLNIYNGGNNPIAFETNDLIRMFIKGDGTVLIASGTTDSGSGALLQVAGPGLQLIGGTQPTCDATHRGEFNVVGATHSAGVKDSVAVCAADAADVYAWRTLY